MKCSTVVRFAAAALALYVGGFLIGSVLQGCSTFDPFSPFKPPDPNAVTSGGAAYTPFARDLRAVMIPLVWGCIAFGAVSIVLSRWIGVFSSKAGATAIALGVGLLLAVNYLIKYEWVVDVAVVGSLVIVGILVGHMLYLKLKGKEGADWSGLFPAFVRKWFAKATNV